MNQFDVILVTGGRFYNRQEFVGRVLERLQPLIIIQGDGGNTDRFAKEWGEANRVHVATVPAYWGKPFFNSAGPRRNQAMSLLRPDLVLAFPGGRGTNGMVKIAKSQGIQVIRVG